MYIKENTTLKASDPIAKTYNKKEGIDFQDTFSLVAKQVTVRTVIALVVLFNRTLHQLDVVNAFLHSDLQEEGFMTLLKGFSNQWEHKVCRLLKSLYGLKQASRQWNLKMIEALVLHDYVQSKHDYSMFTKNVGAKQVIFVNIC